MEKSAHFGCAKDWIACHTKKLYEYNYHNQHLYMYIYIRKNKFFETLRINLLVASKNDAGFTPSLSRFSLGSLNMLCSKRNFKSPG